MKIKKLLKSIKGFTLVELIVVIGIVSVLAVVGGLTVTQFVGDGRDARIKADLTNIAKGLEIYHVENREYPLPTNATGSTVLQGEWGSGNTEDVLFEPHSKQSDGTNFIYTVTADQQNYSIAGWINGEEISYNNLIGEKVYAAGRNYKGMKLFKIGNIDIPIIVNRNTWEPVSENTEGTGEYVVLDKETKEIGTGYSSTKEAFSGVETEVEVYIEENQTICEEGYEDDGNGNCVDINPPTGGSISINNGDTSTSSVNVNLTIGCPTDVEGSTPIEMEITGDITGTPSWETCSASKAITLANTKDGDTNNISVKFRDNVGNESGVENDSIEYINVDNTSCKTILESGGSDGDGVYLVDPDGEGGVSPFEVYCDMSTDGGGWTMIGKQTNHETGRIGFNSSLRGDNLILSESYNGTTQGSIIDDFNYSEMLFKSNSSLWFSIGNTLSNFSLSDDGTRVCRDLDLVSNKKSNGINLENYTHMNMFIDSSSSSMSSLVVGSYHRNYPVDSQCGEVWCSTSKHGRYDGGCADGPYGEGDWMFYVR